jgi:hypothetical protein
MSIASAVQFEKMTAVDVFGLLGALNAYAVERRDRGYQLPRRLGPAGGASRWSLHISITSRPAALNLA